MIIYGKLWANINFISYKTYIELLDWIFNLNIYFVLVLFATEDYGILHGIM